MNKIWACINNLQYYQMAKICTLDVFMLFLTKMLRMFSFGAISVVFFGLLMDKGIMESEIGILQSLIAVGDILISLVLTTRADKIGRKKTLIISALLKILAGVAYAISDNYMILLISGALGVLTISGGEIGPFLPIEQAAIAQLIEDNEQNKDLVKEEVSMMYGYYNMASYLSQAAGNLFTGFYLSVMQQMNGGAVEQYYIHIVYMYAIFGLLKVICYACLSGKIEAEPAKVQDKELINCAGLKKESNKVIIMLSLLFFVDSFAGGFVAQSFLSYYYEKKYDFQMNSIGGILFVCNIVGGISGVLSSKLVARIGAMATMIFTHLPSNVFLLLISLTSNPQIAVLLIMGRFCISQMDVPARQTYVSMVVSTEERSAANGITNIARSVGVSLAFPIAGLLWDADPSSFKFSAPFLIAGALKIFYDLTLGACFLWSKSAQKAKEKQDFHELNEVEMESQSKVEGK